MLHPVRPAAPMPYRTPARSTPREPPSPVKQPGPPRWLVDALPWLSVVMPLVMWAMAFLAMVATGAGGLGVFR